MPNPTITSLTLDLIIGADDGLCGMCGTYVSSPLISVGTDVDTPVCQDCTDKHGRGMWELAEGLGSIASALFVADPENRPDLIDAALNTLKILAQQCKAAEQVNTAPVVLTEQEKAGYAEAIRDAAEELGVSPADMRGMSWTELFDGLSVRYRRKSMGVAGKQDPNAEELQDVAALLAQAADQERGKS